MRSQLTHLALLGSVLSLAACTITKTVDDTATAFEDADADTDADTDVDTDADTDADTDVDWEGQSTEGSISYGMIENGTVVCDAEIEFAGGAYTGACDGCDYAFSVDATIVEDNSTADCSYFAPLSFIENVAQTDFILAHASNYYVSSGYYDYLVNDALLLGYHYYGAGPYFRALIYEGSAYGEAVTDGSQISWGFEYLTEGYTYTTAYLDDCGADVASSEATEDFGGDLSETSTLNCDGSVLDLWEVTADSADDLSISVDTVSDSTTFDPWFFVIDPDGCTTYLADDNFECAYPPPEYSCPSVSLAAEAGTYQIAVLGYADSCAGSTAEYELTVDGADGATLTLIADDADSSVSTWESTEYAVNGCADIYAEGETAPGTPCEAVAHGLEDADETGEVETGTPDTGTGSPE
jgi:hypothetical protein